MSSCKKYEYDYDFFKPKRVEIVELGKRFESIRACARYLETQASAIRNCIQHPQRTCYGYHIRLIDDYEY